MPIVADVYDFVIGVDTHARAHQYAIITTAGRVVAERSFPNTTTGISKVKRPGSDGGSQTSEG